jgi:hypothetical protein
VCHHEVVALVVAQSVGPEPLVDQPRLPNQASYRPVQALNCCRDHLDWLQQQAYQPIVSSAMASEQSTKVGAPDNARHSVAGLEYPRQPHQCEISRFPETRATKGRLTEKCRMMTG